MSSQKDYTGHNTTINPNESILNMSKAISNIRDYDEMKRWAIDMCYRGGKMYEIVHGRTGNNDKELSVRQGELVEVLDDKRNWWKLRSYYGVVGYVPVTILKKFEINNNNLPSAMPNQNLLAGGNVPEKVFVKYFFVLD
jgi:hypothetical protein